MNIKFWPYYIEIAADIGARYLNSHKRIFATRANPQEVEVVNLLVISVCVAFQGI